nr:hypothetical protein [Tanacetum cinerariifolium]
MIGALMYLTTSRPDIVHATCLCARYQAKPTEKHLKEVKRIFRYLRGTINTGLWYSKDYGFELTGFLDADYTRCKDIFKSTSGGAQFLGEKLSKYVLEILKKYGMESCDPVGTPMEIKDKLDLDQNGTPVDATKYRSMIGTLMYLTSSRPDIVHATCLCARYQAKPTEKHLKEDSGFELTGFSDADYAGCKDTFKSTSGGAQFLGEKLVSWSSKKQELPTKMELELEQSQQGSSHEVSVSTEGVKELKRIVRIKGVKKEALHTTLDRNQDQSMALQPHSSRVKIQDLMLNYQRFIQDESSRCQSNYRGSLLASFQDLEHEGGDTRSQGDKRFKDKRHKDLDPRSQACKWNFKRIPKNTRLQVSRRLKKDSQLNDHPLERDC